jgi:hypothetical protein
LDSRPLSDTLSVLLGQRSKSFESMLKWNYDANSSLPHDKPNGHAQPSPNGPLSEHCSGEAVKSIICTALNSISLTVRAARTIYEGDDQPSLIRRMLEYIQSGSSTPPEHSQQLPPELCLTTQTLLTALPSSTHFLLLPADLRTYKPYVDLSSSSSFVSHSHVKQKVDEWFHQSSSSLHTAIDQWFLSLGSIKEIWSVRSSTKKCISHSGLKQKETSHLMNILDESCRTRIIRIWKLKLESTLKCFEDDLDSRILSLNDISKSKRIRGWNLFIFLSHAVIYYILDSFSVNFLFQPTPFPIHSQTTFGQGEVSFQKYKSTLRRQIIGRTTLLDDVLATLENCARTIKQDLSHVMASGDETWCVLKSCFTLLVLN